MGIFYNMQEEFVRKPDFTEDILGASQILLHLNHTKTLENKHNS